MHSIRSFLTIYPSQNSNGNKKRDAVDSLQVRPMVDVGIQFSRKRAKGPGDSVLVKGVQQSAEGQDMAAIIAV